MKSYIELKNMYFHAHHGVLEEETIIGNDFYVNLRFETDITPAFDSDDVNDTLNYAEAYDIVKEEMAIPSKLLEHVAGRIFRRLKQQFPQARIVELSVAKNRPPVSGEVEQSIVALTE